MSAAVTREALAARYREMIGDVLPRLAHEQGWTLRDNHCFGRILLDDAVGGRWYDVLDRRRSPVFLQLDDDGLTRAVAMAERLATEGDRLVRELDARSLAWRGKPPKHTRRSSR